MERRDLDPDKQKHLKDLTNDVIRPKEALLGGTAQSLDGIHSRVSSAIESAQRLVNNEVMYGLPVDNTRLLSWHQSTFSLGIHATLRLADADPVLRAEMVRGYMQGFVETTLKIAERSS